MKVVNHKISMMRGETPTYFSSVKFADGTPYMNTDPANLYCFEFVVRPSIYASGNDFVFRTYKKVNTETIPIFPSRLVIDYGEAAWNDDIGPQAGYEYYLHRLKVGDIYEYRIYKDRSWITYSFDLEITFPYSSTRHFEPKIYYYEINLLGGIMLAETPRDSSVCPLETIVVKIPLITPKEFKVEASIGV